MKEIKEFAFTKEEVAKILVEYIYANHFDGTEGSGWEWWVSQASAEGHITIRFVKVNFR